MLLVGGGYYVYPIIFMRSQEGGEAVDVGVVKDKQDDVPEPPAKSRDSSLEPAAKFISLFNGTDLTGWETDDGGVGNWKVVDGALTCSGKESYLYTTRNDFDDFHLRVEAKINDVGNSGVWFRGLKIPNAYHAKIALAKTKQAFLTGSIGGHVKVTEDLVKPDTWFTMEVIAVGPHMRILLDGKEAVNYEDIKATRRGWGHFAVEHHDAGTKVSFRRIEILPLKNAGKANNVTVPETKDKDQKKQNASDESLRGQFISLFNGTDLTGWVEQNGGLGNWHVVDGAITCSGAGSHLFTTRDDFEDFHLRVEGKFNDVGKSGVHFRCFPLGRFTAGYQAQIALATSFKQAYLTVSLNDHVKVAEDVVKPDSWFHHGSDGCNRALPRIVGENVAVVAEVFA